MTQVVTPKKIMKGMEYAFFNLFLGFSLIFSLALYALVEFYFIIPTEEFDMQSNEAKRIDAKAMSLKTFDFEVFEGGAYEALRAGNRHEFNRDSLRVGNKEPFIKGLKNQ